jgi:hypothetical protein
VSFRAGEHLAKRTGWFASSPAIFVFRDEETAMTIRFRGLCGLIALLSALLAAVLLISVPATAQTFRGTILGTVTDTSGAVIAGAKVTVRSAATGLVRETQTSSDGSYAVPELPIGTYTVTVEQAGFQTAVTTDVKVDVAAERRVDATLQPGAVTQRVTVSGESLPQIQTTSDVLGSVLEPAQITSLPSNGGDFQKLIYQVPGIAGSPDQITDSPGSFGVFSMNGSRGRSNNFLLDGTDMNDGFRNDPAINEAGVFGDPATILPIDAIAELHVLSNYLPEFGRNSGAIINIVTKSGTNDFHGTAFEFLRNNWLDARNFFNDVGTRQNPFRNNQFGGSLGGPIKRDKLFFYLNYEGQREGGAQTSRSCVPSANSLAIARANVLARGGTVDPVITNLLARNPWPQPNLNVAADNTGCPNGPNAAVADPFVNDLSSGIVKVDYNINRDNFLAGRYFIGDSSQSFPLGLVGGGILPGFNTITPTRVQLVSLSLVSVVSPTMVNEARVGWNRFAEGFFPQDRSFNPASIGLNTGVGPQDFGLPKISVGGASGGFAVVGATSSVPRFRFDTNWQFVDGLSWKRGRHDWKFGFEFRRTSISLVQDSNFRGKLSFNTLEDFLRGVISGGGSQARGDTNRNTFEDSFGWYAQDSFRWTPRLTLNYGIRWDLFGVPGEKHGLFFNFFPSTLALVQVRSLALDRLYSADHKDFAPRFSFAYDLTGKGQAVIRGGYGIFFDAFSQDIFLGHIPFNCTFCPGPAYAGIGPGNSAIFLSSDISRDTAGNPVPLSRTQPVYAPASPLGDFFSVDRNIKTPYVQNFNLNIERAFGAHAALQVGYVGSLGRRLFRFRDINQPTQAAITACDLGTLAGCAGPPTIHSFSVPRRLTQSFFFINQEQSSSASNYHSLQVVFRFRNWHGLTSQANYVWSHSIDDASDLEDFVPNQAQPNDSNRPQLEKGNSSFDIRNRFVWNFVYDFPKFTGAWPKLTQGWGIDGVLTLQGGQPFLLNYNFEGDFDGSGGGFGRPDIVPGAKIVTTGDPNRFLDLSNFAVPCTVTPPAATTPPTPVSDGNCNAGTRHFGNLGRNSLRGPDFRQFDFSIFKNTALTERLTMQIRANFYNLANHPNFSSPLLPNFIADAAQNGICTTASPGRPQTCTVGRSLASFGLTATGDVGIGNPFLGGGGPRGIELAVKFTF